MAQTAHKIQYKQQNYSVAHKHIITYTSWQGHWIWHWSVKQHTAHKRSWMQEKQSTGYMFLSLQIDSRARAKWKSTWWEHLYWKCTSLLTTSAVLGLVVTPSIRMSLFIAFIGESFRFWCPTVHDLRVGDECAEVEVPHAGPVAVAGIEDGSIPERVWWVSSSVVVSSASWCVRWHWDWLEWHLCARRCGDGASDAIGAGVAFGDANVGEGAFGFADNIGSSPLAEEMISQIDLNSVLCRAYTHGSKGNEVRYCTQLPSKTYYPLAFWFGFGLYKFRRNRCPLTQVFVFDLSAVHCRNLSKVFGHIRHTLAKTNVWNVNLRNQYWCADLSAL